MAKGTSKPAGRMLECQEGAGEHLGALGLSEIQVLSEIKRQLASVQLYDEVTKKAKKITEADVSAYYNEHRAEIATLEKRHLRNVVVATRQDADAVLTELRSGADFAKVAARRSLDQSTKDNGGDLGTVTAEQLEPGYGRAAFAAKKNALFGPVQTQYGWNVGKVLHIHPGEPLSLNAAHDRGISSSYEPALVFRQSTSALWLEFANPRCHLNARSEAELGQDVVDVSINRAMRNYKLSGDLFVGQATGD